jgi:hypothetical protein
VIKTQLKHFILVLASIWICPSWADNSSALIEQTEADHNTEFLIGHANTKMPESQPGKQDIHSPQTNPLIAGKNNNVNKAPLAKKVFSVATALAIGTPVCIIRRTKYEEWYGVHGLIGNSNNKTKKVVAGVFWFPFALLCGTGEAPFDAVANGLMYPAFSKDQLSQGNLIQNN